MDKIIDEEKIQNFISSLKGEVVRSGDARYDRARLVWNGMINRHPSLIVYCFDKEDVIHSVNFARSNNLLVAVRNGGHNVAGNAVCNNGIVIDLSQNILMEIVFIQRKLQRMNRGKYRPHILPGLCLRFEINPESHFYYIMGMPSIRHLYFYVFSRVKFIGIIILSHNKDMRNILAFSASHPQNIAAWIVCGNGKDQSIVYRHIPFFNIIWSYN